jgi:arylsulfatase A-like enzyme
MANSTVSDNPNIILITVDQMRFPMHFPPGINSADGFIAEYMPHLFTHLWGPGVKFKNYYTAASDCTAARATIHTGLYAYQTYMMLTLTTYPRDHEPPDARPQLLQPELNAAFPTIGHLMRPDYVTPYHGKWHLSYHAEALERYGYTSYTRPEDIPGFAGQGDKTDLETAVRAADWVNEYDADTSPGKKPFFLTLNFVNPHDKQWFWGGMQATDYHKVYESIPEKGPQTFTMDYVREGHPAQIYPQDINRAIGNWQDDNELAHKPSTQSLVKQVFQYQMGGISERDDESSYTPVNDPAGFAYAVTPLVPSSPPKHKAIAPETYWSKALDSYLEVLGMVDNAIDAFMSNIPATIKKNAIFIFTSDHGEYGSSHGLQGKGGTVYEEGILVPLICYDPSKRYFNSSQPTRSQLCSSVDLLPLIVSLGHGGTMSWRTGKYQQLYGQRCDLLRILREGDAAPSRPYALHTTDEFVDNTHNYLDAPLHVIGQIEVNQTGKRKLGVYTTWEPYALLQGRATVLRPAANCVEFYDYANYADPAAPDETTSTPGIAAAQTALTVLYGEQPGTGQIIQELQALLPLEYQEAQALAYQELQNYMLYANGEPGTTSVEAIEDNDERLTLVWAF